MVKPSAPIERGMIVILLDRVGVRQQRRDQRVTRLVVRDQRAVLRPQHAAPALEPGHQAIRGEHEVLGLDRVGALLRRRAAPPR